MVIYRTTKIVQQCKCNITFSATWYVTKRFEVSLPGTFSTSPKQFISWRPGCQLPLDCLQRLDCSGYCQRDRTFSCLSGTVRHFKNDIQLFIRWDWDIQLFFYVCCLPHCTFNFFTGHVGHLAVCHVRDCLSGTVPRTLSYLNTQECVR